MAPPSTVQVDVRRRVYATCLSIAFLRRRCRLSGLRFAIPNRSNNIRAFPILPICSPLYRFSYATLKCYPPPPTHSVASLYFREIFMRFFRSFRHSTAFPEFLFFSFWLFCRRFFSTWIVGFFFAPNFWRCLFPHLFRRCFFPSPLSPLYPSYYHILKHFFFDAASKLNIF